MLRVPLCSAKGGTASGFQWVRWQKEKMRGRSGLEGRKGGNGSGKL